MKLRLTIALMGFVITASTCEAQGIFKRSAPGQAPLVEDLRARNVGDTMTVLIRETTDVENRDQRQLDKSNQTGGKANFTSNTTGDLGTSTASGAFDTSSESNRKFDGSSRTLIERDFIDRITVTVREVLPNGYLVIEGRRTQRVTGEERVLVISGIVRPYDVLANNTVMSQSIANLDFAYEGKGVETAFNSQGWFSKMFNKIWPF